MNTVVSTIHYNKCSTLGVGFLECYSNSMMSLLCCPNYKYQHATEQNIASPSTPQHGFLALPSGGSVLKDFIVSGIEWGSLRFVEIRLLSSTQRGLTARVRAMRVIMPQTSSGAFIVHDTDKCAQLQSR